MSAEERLLTFSKTVWEAVVAERNIEAIENNDSPSSVVSWENLTEEQKAMITQSVEWMLETMKVTAYSFYQEWARKDFMESATQPTEQE